MSYLFPLELWILGNIKINQNRKSRPESKKLSDEILSGKTFHSKLMSETGKTYDLELCLYNWHPLSVLLPRLSEKQQDLPGKFNVNASCTTLKFWNVANFHSNNKTKVDLWRSLSNSYCLESLSTILSTISTVSFDPDETKKIRVSTFCCYSE